MLFYPQKKMFQNSPLLTAAKAMVDFVLKDCIGLLLRESNILLLNTHPTYAMPDVSLK